MTLAELQREEVRFLETLERGEKLLAEVLASKPRQISGARPLSSTTPTVSRLNSPRRSLKSRA